jgi:hypothetical protein
MFATSELLVFLSGGVAILAISGKMLDSLLAMRGCRALPEVQQLFPSNGFVTGANR